MYLSAGGLHDQCSNPIQTIQNTSASPPYTMYQCNYKYNLPTPKPTPPPVSTTSSTTSQSPVKLNNNKQMNVNEKVQIDSELLGYLNEYYANYQKGEASERRLLDYIHDYMYNKDN